MSNEQHDEFYYLNYLYAVEASKSKTYKEIYNNIQELFFKNTERYKDLVYTSSFKDVTFLNFWINYNILNHKIGGELLDILIENHYKGVAYFTENFKVMNPSKMVLKNLSLNFNEKWKLTLCSVDSILSEHTMIENGFENGLLTAYIEFEENNFYLFDKLFQPQQPEPVNKSASNLIPKIKRDYKEMDWFKTGIKLATGEAYDLYDKYKEDRGHYLKICLELGFNEKCRTFFSSTITDNKKTNNNTFANKDKLQKLHKHLTKNNLPFGYKFLEKYNQIEAK